MTQYKKSAPKFRTFLGWENDPPLSCEEYFGTLICLLETIKRNKATPSDHLLDEIIHHLRRAWDLVPDRNGTYCCFRCERMFFDHNRIQSFLDPDGKRYLYCAICINELGDKFYDGILDENDRAVIKEWVVNEMGDIDF